MWWFIPAIPELQRPSDSFLVFFFKFDDGRILTLKCRRGGWGGSHGEGCVWVFSAATTDKGKRSKNASSCFPGLARTPVACLEMHSLLAQVSSTPAPFGVQDQSIPSFSWLKATVSNPGNPGLQLSHRVSASTLIQPSSLLPCFFLSVTMAHSKSKRCHPDVFN